MYIKDYSFNLELFLSKVLKIEWAITVYKKHAFSHSDFIRDITVFRKTWEWSLAMCFKILKTGVCIVKTSFKTHSGVLCVSGGGGQGGITQSFMVNICK